MKEKSFSKGDRVKIRTRFHPSIFDGVTGAVINKTSIDVKAIEADTTHFLDYSAAGYGYYRVRFDHPVQGAEGTMFIQDIFPPDELIREEVVR